MRVGLPPFQSLLDRHREDVYRFLVAVVGPHDADDCFQETFLAALRAYPRLRGDSNLRAWIFTIAHRKALDALRARARAPLPLEDADGAHHDAPSDGMLWRVVRGLPPKQRAVVVHRYVGGLPYGEIARVLGCSEDAARRSAHEGVKKLREVLER